MSIVRVKDKEDEINNYQKIKLREISENQKEYYNLFSKKIIQEVSCSFPNHNLKRDNSLGFSPDSFERMFEPNFFTIRLDRKARVRVPVTKRMPIYEGIKKKVDGESIYRTERSSETSRGHFVMDEFVACNFDELSAILTSPEMCGHRCSRENLDDEIERIERIYGKIDDKHPVSVYFSDKVILV
ncbi:hypothetical protein KY314_00830 [Candidatus Woesearchaeota archaeon]|nr:hypothetical protein [Candidatus Woesearchaeota archaeon]